LDVAVEGTKHEHSPDKEAFGNNDISMIQNNNSTFPDTSMNTTHFSLINKLQDQKFKKQQTIDNFDQQSSTSYLFNEDELAKYEEDI